MSKRQINLIFALIVIGLATAAALSIYMDSGTPVIRYPVQGGSSDNPLPENHPPADTSQQLALLMQMSTEDPQDAAVQAEIGNIYFDREEYDKAIPFYRKSMELRPGDPYVETDLATCFYHLNRDDEALKILDEVLKNQPDFQQALYNKGVILIHGKNNIKEGLAVWEELLKSDLDPDRRSELEQSIQRLKSSIK